MASDVREQSLHPVVLGPRTLGRPLQFLDAQALDVLHPDAF